MTKASLCTFVEHFGVPKSSRGGGKKESRAEGVMLAVTFYINNKKVPVSPSLYCSGDKSQIVMNINFFHACHFH